MANVTVQEFSTVPDTNGDLPRPASIVTTVASPATVNLRDSTRYVIVSSDADTRVGFNASALTSGTPVLSAVENGWRLQPGSGRTLQFA